MENEQRRLQALFRMGSWLRLHPENEQVMGLVCKQQKVNKKIKHDLKSDAINYEHIFNPTKPKILTNKNIIRKKKDSSKKNKK